MKGTIMEIVGQESGFVLAGRECRLDNWSRDLDDYQSDLRKKRKVENCFLFLIERGFIAIDGDEISKDYIEDANPVTIEDLMVTGILYDFGDFEVLAPEGWN